MGFGPGYVEERIASVVVERGFDCALWCECEDVKTAIADEAEVGGGGYG